MSERYDIVFRGDIIEGFFLQQVKTDLARLMKVEADAVAPLFSGRPERLKKNVDLATAEKYRVVLQKIGMRVDLKAVEDTSEAAKEVAKTAHPAQKSQSSVAIPKTISPQIAESQELNTTVRDVGITLAPPGAILLTEESERQKQARQATVVDVEHLSLDQQAGYLMHADERKDVIEPVAVDLSDYSIADAGEDLLHADEKQEFIPLEVDIADITMADVGATLSEEKQSEKYKIPDISHLQLSESDLSK